MAKVIKRIMYGNEIVGYITNNPDERYINLDKELAIHFASTGLLDNVKVVNNGGKLSLSGINGTNLNDLERLNINIENIDKDIYNYIGDKQVLKLLTNIADGINNSTKIEGRIYKALLDFVNKADMQKYNTFKGINVSIFRNNIMTGDRVTFKIDWGKSDRLQIECNTLNNEMLIKAAVYGSNNVPYTITTSLIGTNASIDNLRGVLAKILDVEGVRYKEKHLTFEEKSQREQNNANRIIAAFIGLANNDKLVSKLNIPGNRISTIEIKQNKVFDTTYSYNIRLGANGLVKLACKVFHKNNIACTQHESIALRAVIEKDGCTTPLNISRLCNKTILYELTTSEVTNLISELNMNLSTELCKCGI